MLVTLQYNRSQGCTLADVVYWISDVMSRNSSAIKWKYVSNELKMFQSNRVPSCVVVLCEKLIGVIKYSSIKVYWNEIEYFLPRNFNISSERHISPLKLGLHSLVELSDFVFWVICRTGFAVTSLQICTASMTEKPGLDRTFNREIASLTLISEQILQTHFFIMM